MSPTNRVSTGAATPPSPAGESPPRGRRVPSREDPARHPARLPLVSERPLLICIDLQTVFLATVPDGASILRRCGFAIESARGLELPVLFTEQVPAKLGRTEPELLRRAPDATVLAKDEFSAFANESIRAAVRDRAATRLLLCGIETPVCVFQTARDALAAGLAVTVLTDSVGARRAGDDAACRDHLARLGATLLPAETVFYDLLGSARHPFFRSYTQLVKQYA